MHQHLLKIVSFVRNISIHFISSGKGRFIILILKDGKINVVTLEQLTKYENSHFIIFVLFVSQFKQFDYETNIEMCKIILH